MSDGSTERAYCGTCPHECLIAPGKLGLCGARGNMNGEVACLNFGQATALALDPIEKKPLAMFHPGSTILSYGSYGCNLRCPFCQNSDISMATAESAEARRAVFISPEELARKAVDLESSGNIGVALTYNEPLIAPEYLCDVAGLLHSNGLLCVVVTNGYSTPTLFGELAKLIDAANIDLKCFSEEGYSRLGAPGGLLSVTTNIEAALHEGVHVEVTTLVVPGISDDEAEFTRECEWLASLDPGIPLHLSRYFPQYRMSEGEPTDIGLLRRFADIASKRLRNVFLGNV